MAKLEYSNSAKRVIKKFHRVDIVVYVEGDDDVVFWEFLFERFLDCTFHVKPVGGKENLQGYLQAIVSGDILDSVASDSDFSALTPAFEHNNIIKTYGYSIENSLVSPGSLREVVRSIGKISSRDISHDECAEWLDSFLHRVEELVFHDISNHVQGHGETVVGDNCSRFMRSDKSVDVCERKVSAYIDSLKFTVDEESKESVLRALGEQDLTVHDLVKGHFLFSAALRYTSRTIAEKRKKVSVSNDSFMGSLVMAFKQVFNERHPEFEYYRSSVTGIQVPA